MTTIEHSDYLRIAMHLAYGDESCDQNAVVYGLVIVAAEHQTAALIQLQNFKVKWGVAADAPLHCWELFRGDRREKTCWAHLKTVDDVFNMLGELADVLTEISSYRVTALAIRNQFPKTLPGGPLLDKDGNFGPSLKEIPFDEKQIAVFCAQCALGQYGHLCNIQDLTFYADPDRTKIDWFMGRKQATNAIGRFHMDKGQGEPPWVDTKLAGKCEEPLIDMADLVAYVRRRTAIRDLSPNGRRFGKLLERLRLTTPRMKFKPDGGLGFLMSGSWENDADR